MCDTEAGIQPERHESSAYLDRKKNGKKERTFLGWLFCFVIIYSPTYRLNVSILCSTYLIAFYNWTYLNDVTKQLSSDPHMNNNIINTTTRTDDGRYDDDLCFSICVYLDGEKHTQWYLFRCWWSRWSKRTGKSQPSHIWIARTGMQRKYKNEEFIIIRLWIKAHRCLWWHYVLLAKHKRYRA